MMTFTVRTLGQICINNLRSSNTLVLAFPLLWAVLAQRLSIGTAFPFLRVLWQLTIDEKNYKKEKNILNYFHLNKASKLYKKNIFFNPKRCRLFGGVFGRNEGSLFCIFFQMKITVFYMKADMFS